MRTSVALVVAGVALVALVVAPTAVSASVGSAGSVSAHGSGGDKDTFTVPATPANPASVDDPATPVSSGDGSSLAILVILGALVVVAVGVWGAFMVIRGGRPAAGEGPDTEGSAGAVGGAEVEGNTGGPTPSDSTPTEGKS